MTQEPGLGKASAPIEPRATQARDAEAEWGELMRIIRECLPGNERQQRVIIDLFVNDLGVRELAELLKTTANNVRGLKFSALKRLRRCQRLLDWLEDWLDRNIQ